MYGSHDEVRWQALSLPFALQLACQRIFPRPARAAGRLRAAGIREDVFGNEAAGRNCGETVFAPSPEACHQL
jgi:hypothetical protein